LGDGTDTELALLKGPKWPEHGAYPKEWAFKLQRTERSHSFHHPKVPVGNEKKIEVSVK